MKTLTMTAFVAGLFCAAYAGASSLSTSTITTNDAAKAETVIANWPQTPLKVAMLMIDKYGQPDESTPSMLIWRNNGPWKKTVVHRDEIKHGFPAPHSDVLEQVISYKVPLDKFNDLARFDGSVTAKRTKGELSSSSDREEMNFLALNLARDVAEGKRSVEDARKYAAQTVRTSMAGKEAAYMKSLTFSTIGDTSDPDQGPAALELK
jgi:hypothetical protein